MMKKAFQKTERITFWIGALCGITLATLDIWHRITPPKPPDLEINFALTGNSNLNIAMKRYMKADAPLDLIVTNKGDLTARSVRLTLIESKFNARDSLSMNIKIDSDNIGFAEKTIYTGQSKNAVTIKPLGDIHPGESKYVGSVLILSVVNQPPIADAGPDIVVSASPPKQYSFPIIHHEVETHISAENLAPKNIKLFITLGSIEELRELHESIFTFDKDEILVPAN